MVNDSFQMPSPFISREEKFATKKPSFARNVSFRVLRNPPACLIKGSLHTTTLMSACVGKVPVFLHRHTCKRTSGCLTALVSGIGEPTVVHRAIILQEYKKHDNVPTPHALARPRTLGRHDLIQRRTALHTSSRGHEVALYTYDV